MIIYTKKELKQQRRKELFKDFAIYSTFVIAWGVVIFKIIL